MRGRYSPADAVEAAKNQVPLIVYRASKPMDKGRNGARYFRNPPQPHMCIQDFIEDTNEPCFINVLSWVKISTPRKPEDPIPLYGGMRVPHNSSAALSLSSHFGAKGQPVIFAVMANPEILRLSGKTAPDPSDRDALVELMIDFVEAMNPDVRFKREFTVLRDRDLAGELKDIWLAVQAKRERERGENGRRGDSDKGRESKEDAWHDETRHRGTRSAEREGERGTPVPAFGHERERAEIVSQDSNVVCEENSTGQMEVMESTVAERKSKNTEESPSVSMSTDAHLLTPSTEPSNDENQRLGAMKYADKSVYSLIRSHYVQEFKSIANDTGDNVKQQRYTDASKVCSASVPVGAMAKPVYPVYPGCVDESHGCLQEASTVAQTIDDLNTSHIVVQSDASAFAKYKRQESDSETYTTAVNSDSNITESLSQIAYDACTQYKEKESSSVLEEMSYARNNSRELCPGSVEECILYTGQEMFTNTKPQMPNGANRSHEDLLPNLNDTQGVKLALGTDHSTIAIP